MTPASYRLLLMGGFGLLLREGLKHLEIAQGLAAQGAGAELSGMESPFLQDQIDRLEHAVP